MELTAIHLGNSKFEVQARDHRVICDLPLENGGTDAGMTPPELLLASLATCAGYYAAQYLKTWGLNVPDLSVRVSAEKAGPPARLGSFTITVTAAGLDARHEKGLLRSVRACLIHNTLLGQPSIECTVIAKPASKAADTFNADLAPRV